ncbi:hypothetical protein Nepgr_008845 [Nepenthes gracilis]|uniref:Uncharacterized protein n=1 Tax=Nepenthes gracilis TaxID=150966 RepID=A0AAD3XJS6_NEPGR|nr:hypothetical protein Nepgr_008845 [Nepenthes gracilis]
MAISASCRLNPHPPPLLVSDSTTSSTNSTKTTTLLPRESAGRSWRSKCVLVMACTIVGSEMANFTMNNEGYAIAKEPPFRTEYVEMAGRWSERRSCPPWILNSFETIVPENLPRPSAHRKWEAVGYSHVAPSVGTITKAKSNCFSM